MTEQEFIWWLRGYLDSFEENAITEKIKDKLKDTSPPFTTSGYIQEIISPRMKWGTTSAE